MRKIFSVLLLLSAVLFFPFANVFSQSPTCNINQIIQAFTNAGYTQLNVQGQPCSIYFYNNSNQSASAAQSSAQALGANLVSIQSQAENDAIVTALLAAGIPSNAVVWIGGRFTTAAHGATDFSWYDGSPVTFTNWNAGEPNNNSGGVGNEDCINLQLNNGFWNDLVCDAQPIGLGPTGPSVIKVNLCPEVSVTGGGQPICTGGQATLNATTLFGSTPYQYAWFEFPNTTPIGTGPTFTPTVNNNTIFVAGVQDRYGCTDTAHVAIATQNCTVPLGCDLTAIRQAYQNAGYAELNVQGQPCALYFYNTQNQSATAAQNAAQTLGANLVSIESQAENDALQQALIQAGFSNAVVWIGGRFTTAAHGPNDFTWYDGSPVGYTNWNPGEPNNNSGGVGPENCIQMVVNSGRWNDLVCDAQPLGLGPRGTSVIKVNLCPEITVTGDGQSVCPGDPAQLSATAILGSTPYSFTWDNGGGSGASVTVNPSVTTNYTATVTDRWGCQATQPATVNIDPNCAQPICDIQAVRNAFQGAGYTEMLTCNNLDPCFMYFLNPNNLDGTTAQTAAQALGANLASINNATENQCLRDWLANNGFSANDYVMIGLNDIDVEGTFVWYDQSPVTYTNWDNGEPNNSGGNEDCVQLRINSGLWNDIPCNFPNSGSIIKVNLCPQITPSPNQTICLGETTQISANTILGSTPYTYSWDNNAGSNASASVSPTANTTYSVTVTDRYSCTATSSTNITVDPNCTPPTCDIQAIRDAFTAATGYVELNVTGQDCSMYFVNTRSQSSLLSQQQAQQLGANMVFFNDEAENIAVINAINNSPYAGQTIWIGVNRTGTAQPTFYALDGTTGPFNPGPATSGLWQNWAPGEPNNNGYQDCFGGCGFIGCDSYRCNNGEQCVQVYADGRWNDLPCNRSSISIVEVNLCPQITVVIPQTICSGQTVQLEATTLLGSTPYGYQWSTNENTAIISVTPSATTNYTVTVTDRYQCSTDTVVTVEVNAAVTTDFTATSPICFNETSTITYTGTTPLGSIFNWNFDGGTIISGSNEGPYQISWATPGVKNISLDIDAPPGSCAGTPTTIQVTVSPELPWDPIVGSDAQVCAGETITLTASAGFANYEWSNGANGQSLTVTTTGNYRVTATDANGCEYVSNTVNIVVHDKPVLTLDNLENVSCFDLTDGSATFAATGGISPYQYVLEPGIFLTGNTAPNLAPGNYTVIVFDALQCNDTVDFIITEPAAPLSINLLLLQNAICHGDANGIIQLEALGGTSDYTFVWSNGRTGASVTDFSNGTYTVTAIDANGCTVEETYTITHPDPILVTVPSNYEVLLGKSVVLTAETGDNPLYAFEWKPDYNLNDPSILQPTATPYLTTTYVVTVRDENDCTGTDTTTVNVLDSIIIYIPNIFSPNNDGINDQFLVYANAVKNFYMIIYDRWGEKVFESEDIFQPWDGNYKGKLAPEGVYVYHIRFTFLNQTQQKRSGSITLVR